MAGLEENISSSSLWRELRVSRLATCISLCIYTKPIVKLCFVITWGRSVPIESESSSPILKINFEIQWLALLRTITLVSHLLFRLLKSSEINLTQLTFWFVVSQTALCNSNQCTDAHTCCYHCRQDSKVSAISCAQVIRVFWNVWQDTLSSLWQLSCLLNLAGLSA